MELIGLEINDAGLTFEGSDGLLKSEPGIARRHDGQVIFGASAALEAHLHPAEVRSRYWQELDVPSLVPPLPGYETPAALAIGQLAAMEAELGIGQRAVVLVVPDHWQREQLARVVGLFTHNTLNVKGLVPASVAATRRRYEGARAWHVEIRMHESVISPLNQEADEVSAGEAQLVHGLGLAALQQRTLAGVSSRFVAESRFDPLHDAHTEQALADQLDIWSDSLTREDVVTAELEHAGRRYSTRLTRSDLFQIQGAAAEPLVRALRASLPASGLSVIQANALLARFPGGIDRLESLPGASVYVLEPGAGARGARRRFNPAGTDGASLVTSLPLDQPPVTGLERETEGSDNHSLPTHLIAGGRAYRLGGKPLRIGAQLKADDYGVTLGSSSSGVSRQHCVIEIQDGKALLFDQSRYGTLLNGHPVNGSAVIQPGDVIAIGTPATQLTITTEVTDRGT